MSDLSKAAAAGAAGGGAGITTAGVLTAAAVVGGGYLLLRQNASTGESPLQALMGSGPEGAPTGLEGFLASLGFGGAPAVDIGDFGPDGVYGTADDVLGGVGSVSDQIADFLDPNGTGFIDPGLLPPVDLSGLLDQTGSPPGAPGEPGGWERFVQGVTNPEGLGSGVQFIAAGGVLGAGAAAVGGFLARGKAAEPAPVNVPKIGGAGEGGLFRAGEGASGTERTVSTRAPQEVRPALGAGETVQFKEPTIRSVSEAKSSAVDAVQARRNLLAGEGDFREYARQRAAPVEVTTPRQRLLNGQSEFQEYARQRAASGGSASTVPAEDPNVVRRQLISGESDFQQYVRQRAATGGQAKPTVVEAGKPVQPGSTKYSSQVQTVAEARAQAQARLRAQNAANVEEARLRAANAKARGGAQKARAPNAAETEWRARSAARRAAIGAEPVGFLEGEDLRARALEVEARPGGLDAEARPGFFEGAGGAFRGARVAGEVALFAVPTIAEAGVMTSLFTLWEKLVGSGTGGAGDFSGQSA